MSSQINRLDTFGFAGAVTKYNMAANGRRKNRPYFTDAGQNWIGGTVYTYDDFGRLTDIDAESDAYGQFMGYERGGYDYNGNPRYTYYAHNEDRSELYGTHTGQDPEGNSDDLNRLTRFRRGTLNANKDDLTATVYEQDWHDTTDALTLDKLGNWDAVRLDEDGDDTASSMTTTERGHNTANEYTSLNGSAAYGHDRNGNLTDDEEFTFYFDFANHLVRAVKQSTGDTVGAYRYDAIGRRVRKVVDDVNDTLDGTTLFFYDGLQVIEEGRLDGNGTYTATHQYLWGFYLDELLVFDYDAQGDFDLEDVSDQRHYCFQDFVYSTVAVMDPDGNIDERYDYEPYGEVSFWSGDYADTRAETAVHLDFLFTGQRYDPETALYHYKMRAALSALGRFGQRDPLGYSDGMNTYTYAAQLPCARTDPWGMQTSGTSGGQWSAELTGAQVGTTYAEGANITVVSGSAPRTGRSLRITTYYCCLQSERDAVKAAVERAYDAASAAYDAVWNWWNPNRGPWTATHQATHTRIGNFFFSPAADIGSVTESQKQTLLTALRRIRDGLTDVSATCGGNTGKCAGGGTAYASDGLWLTPGAILLCHDFFYQAAMTSRDQAGIISHEIGHHSAGLSDAGWHYSYVYVSGFTHGRPTYEAYELGANNQLQQVMLPGTNIPVQFTGGVTTEQRLNHADTYEEFIDHWY